MPTKPPGPRHWGIGYKPDSAVKPRRHIANPPNVLTPPAEGTPPPQAPLGSTEGMGKLPRSRLAAKTRARTLSDALKHK